MRKPKRKSSTFWIQTQNCVPHSLSLKTGTVSKGFSDGPCTLSGMRAEGALGNTALVPQSVTLDCDLCWLLIWSMLVCASWCSKMSLEKPFKIEAIKKKYLGKQP